MVAVTKLNVAVAGWGGGGGDGDGVIINRFCCVHGIENPVSNGDE